MIVVLTTLQYIQFRNIGAFVLDGAGQNILNAVMAAFAVVGVLVAWLAYNAQPPKPRFKRRRSRFPVTTPPSVLKGGAKDNAARWYHLVSLQNRGGRAATKPRVTIKAPSPILARRFTPSTGQDAFAPIPDPDPSILQLKAKQVGPGDRVVIELWTVAEDRPKTGIKFDEGIQIWKIDDYPSWSLPSPFPIAVVVTLVTVALVVAFYFIGRKP